MAKKATHVHRLNQTFPRNIYTFDSVCLNVARVDVRVDILDPASVSNRGCDNTFRFKGLWGPSTGMIVLTSFSNLPGFAWAV
mmetsp:Transcript_16790/g.23488  ORF Transcript_16790/g.23488 Transcript_16790/m.23488 type:complete len:82 (-) Transcript_16790:253-498(-)